MKTILRIPVLTGLLMLVSFSNVYSQTDTSGSIKPLYVITTNDGGTFKGYIISQDAKEVLIDTRDKGQVSIPKYEIREMKEIQQGDLSPTGNYLPAEVFATRYFITTNGLPIEKRESYILWNLWGLDG